MKTTIVLADDHPIVRQGLKTVLEAEPDFRVIGEAGDGQAVRTKIRGLSHLDSLGVRRARATPPG